MFPSASLDFSVSCACHILQPLFLHYVSRIFQLFLSDECIRVFFADIFLKTSSLIIYSLHCMHPSVEQHFVTSLSVRKLSRFHCLVGGLILNKHSALFVCNEMFLIFNVFLFFSFLESIIRYSTAPSDFNVSFSDTSS